VDLKKVPQKDRHLPSRPVTCSAPPRRSETWVDLERQRRRHEADLPDGQELRRRRHGRAQRACSKIAILKGKTVAASAPGHGALLHPRMVPEEERANGRRTSPSSISSPPPRRRLRRGQNDAAMTYEPYLSTVRTNPAGGKIIATTLDYPMVDGHVRLHARNSSRKIRRRAGDRQQLLRSRRHDQSDPKKSYEIMGADVKQTGAEFEASAEVPALAGQGREPEILRRRVQQFSRRPRQLLTELGIIKSDPDLDDDRRHAFIK
jgi:NitT/TauT family transport system substrate-binding protein